VKHLRSCLASSRPATSVFAALLVLIGFRYFHPVPWNIVVILMIAISLVTASIMTWNDYIDRVHDSKKGKTYARDNPRYFVHYLLGLVSGVIVTLACAFALDVWTGLFCCATWIVGMAYSFMTKWYLLQNLVVACCSGAPILIGMVFKRTFDVRPSLLFGACVFVVLAREIHKDMEDATIDRGYKNTVPVIRGHSIATLWAYLLAFGWVTCLLSYPHPALKAISLVAVLCAFNTARLFFNYAHVDYAKRLMDSVITLILVVTLVTQ
jgi:4-hydroxybenzoate polyprenyltransferase